MPDFKCECGKPAKEICAECVYEEKGLLCEECAKKHNCEEEMRLPLVNVSDTTEKSIRTKLAQLNLI